MNIKHRKLMFVAGVINALLGAFYLISGLLEFTNTLTTAANTVKQTIGVQLSYLIFLSSLLTTASGILAIIYTNSLKKINLQVFLGATSLAWPLFLSITLFFTQLHITIRLITMTISSLFFVVAVLIVKITNSEFSKGVKFNPSAIIAASGKRSKTVNINSVISPAIGKAQTKNVLHKVEDLASNMSTTKNVGANFRSVYTRRRRKSGPRFRGLYAGRRRNNKHIFSFLTQGKRHRSSFRLKK